MESKKQLRLYDIIQRLAIENMAMKFIIQSHKRYLPIEFDLDGLIACADRDPDIGGFVRAQFEPLRARLSQAPDDTEALQALLRVFPPNREVN